MRREAANGVHLFGDLRDFLHTIFTKECFDHRTEYRYTKGFHMQQRSAPIRVLTWLVAALLLGTWPASAQTPSVDSLLAQIFGTDATAYDLTATLSGTVAFSTRETRWVGNASGTFHEWRTVGQPRRWKISIEKLELPTLLRPFSSPLQRAIEDRAAAQSEALESLHSHDFFILEELKGRYVLAGIRRDLVDEAIDRYGRTSDKGNPSVRRFIARWLYTAPTMRESIKRPRGPYAVRLVTDEHGLVDTVALYYNWGQIDMTFAYITLAGRPFWHTANSIIASEVTGLGHVDGVMKLTFAQHRLSPTP